MTLENEWPVDLTKILKFLISVTFKWNPNTKTRHKADAVRSHFLWWLWQAYIWQSAGRIGQRATSTPAASLSHTQLCPASPQLHCPLEMSFRNSPLQAASCVVVACEICPGIVNCHGSS